MNSARPLRREDKVAIILLALCPILQHYKGFFVNASVTILLLLTPYVFMKLSAHSHVQRWRFGIVLPVIVSFMFQVVDHGTDVTELGQAIIVAVFLVAIANGSIDTSYFVKIITSISVLACICIILQYICYYVLGFHLQMVPTSLLLPRSQQWVLLAQTGRHSITGKMIKFYRPSAFFLEPSHMFMYMFSPLTIAMFADNGKKTRRIAFLLATGMILTTSGMGVMATAMLYALYMGKKGGKNKRFTLKKIFQPRNLFAILMAIVLCIVAYFNVPFIRNSVERIFGSGVDYTNAVSGRMDSGFRLIQSMSGMQILLGVKDGLSGVTASLSGLNETMFQYGIVGVILSYIFYVRGLWTLKNEYFWVAVLILIVSLFSQHTHSTFFILYATVIFFDGYKKYGLCKNWHQRKNGRVLLDRV